MGEIWKAIPEEIKAFIISVVANLVNFDNLVGKIKNLGVDQQYHSDIEDSLKAALKEYSKNEQIRVRTKERLGNVEKTLIPAIAGKDVELTEEQIAFLDLFEIEFAKTGYYNYLHYGVTKEIKADTHEIKKILKTQSFVGVDLPEDFYENLTQAIFDYETIIGGRNEISDLVYTNYKSGKSFDIISHSEDESIAFILASMKKNKSIEDFDDIYICRNIDGISSLQKLEKRRIVIAPSYLLVDHQIALQKLFGQIIGVDFYTSSVNNQQEKVDVPKYLNYDMTNAIQKEMQKTNEDASILSKKGQGVLVKLLREIKTHSNKPEWLLQIQIKNAVPAILIAEWHDDDEWQQEYLKELGITNYIEFSQELIKISGEGDTFIYMINGYWRVRDVVESLTFLYDKILPGQIAIFKNYAKEVLKDINPYSNLKGIEGFIAFRNGIKANINEQFKSGIFKVLIGIEHLSHDDHQTLLLKSIRDEIIETIFNENENNAQTENNFYYITKYIEAAPERTLIYIQEILRYNNDVILSIFHKEKQAKLILALEGVSTYPKHFHKVIELLINLHKIDPGGNLNRPLDSLKILLNFNFASNVEPRMKFEGIVRVLNSIPEKYDEFLVEILRYPNNRFINEKYKFKYGYKFRLEKQVLEWPEYYKIFDELIPHIIEAEINTGKKALFGIIYSLHKNSRMSFLKVLIDEQTKLSFDTEFWKELFFYKEYKRTNQQTSKLEDDEEMLINELISICNKNNAADRKLWIFNQGSYAIIASENSLDEYNDHNKIEQIVIEERKVIVREIFDSSIEYFVKFTISNEDPFWVMNSLKDVISQDEAINTIVFFVKVKHLEAFKYIGSLVIYFSKEFGIKWIENCYLTLQSEFQNPEYSVSILLNCVPSNEIIQFVETHNIEGYFEHLSTGFHFGDIEVKKAYIKKFIDVGRASDGLSIMRYESELYDEQFCIVILEKATEQIAEVAFDLHVIERIFKKLQKCDIDIILMANLEFRYSAYLLGGYPKVGIPNLSKLFFTNPEELLKVINYKNNETDFHKMRFYGDILDNIARFPLSGDDDTDREALKNFIQNIKSVADSFDCEGTVDFILGGILSKIPRINYEPKEYVCELIEQYYSEKLAQGFIYRGRSHNYKSFGNGHLESFKNEIEALNSFKSKFKKSLPKTSMIIDHIMRELKSNVESLERNDVYDVEGQWIG